MPGLDGTGPRGLGPMTGGARGLCGGGLAGLLPLRRPWASAPGILGRGLLWGLRPRLGLRRGWGAGFRRRT